jgi:hypothetical protein
MPLASPIQSDGGQTWTRGQNRLPISHRRGIPWTTRQGSPFLQPFHQVFTSARDYIAANPEPPAESASKPPANANADADAARANKPKPLSNAGHKDGLTQASIANFFAGPGSQKREPVLPSYPQPPPSHRYEGLSSQNQRSGAGIVPPTLSSHRVQPRPLIPTRPTLEPTNPNGYTWLAAPSKPTLKPARMSMSMTQEQSSNSTSASGTAGAEVKPESSTRGFQPVTTFHSTTMSMVQQAPRRTLGIRRSMNGWQDRMKREGGG